MNVDIATCFTTGLCGGGGPAHGDGQPSPGLALLQVPAVLAEEVPAQLHVLGRVRRVGQPEGVLRQHHAEIGEGFHRWPELPGVHVRRDELRQDLHITRSADDRFCHSIVQCFSLTDTTVLSPVTSRKLRMVRFTSSL